METKRLGRSGLVVSRLCLGAMTFGARTDEAASQGIVAAAREAGCNFIDTADVYNAGESERITGRAIAAHRNDWVLATKLCNPMGDGPNARGLSRRWIIEACEASLQRLGTDHIDLYYFHKEDRATPLEESVMAARTLMEQGKIRYLGLSNFRAWRIAEVCRICDELGMPRPVACQPYYHAMYRVAEVEQLPACGHYGLGVVSYSPLARGVLTGKYAAGAAPAADTRAGVKDPRMMETEFREGSLEVAAKIVAHAKARGLAPEAFAIGWVLRNRLITGVIAGPRTLEQWDGYAAAVGAELDDYDEVFVDGLVVTGHPSTPGYNDPAYPIEGRPV